MKKALFLGLLATLSLMAQEEAAMAIAGTIVPTSEKMVSNFTACVEKLTGLPALSGNKKAAEKGIDACMDISKIASKEARGLGSEASGAAKALRPLVISSYRNRYGGYRGGYYDDGVTVYQPPRTPRAPRYHTPRYHTPRDSRPEKK